MQVLTDLISEISTSIESDGSDAEFIIDKNRGQLLGELLQIAQGFDEQNVNLKAAKTEIERARKYSNELQSSCEALGRTISEQSDTLNNREKIVQEAEHDRDEALQRIDDLTATYEILKANALAGIQKGDDITPVEFAAALDLYSLAVARISSTDAHPQIVVALVQMAMHIRQLETVADIIKWLRGSQ